MTKRLYYQDAYTVDFEAEGREFLTVDNQSAVVLDQTFFYPTSGGQPHDLGELNGIAVVDVFEREKDGAVVHVLAASLADGPVTGRIDWTRRFDHMQQHTAQHILSQAFIQVADAETIGFHLSDNSVTIDLDKPDLDDRAVNAAEQVANEIVWQNRPVTMRFVEEGEAAELALRKLPAGRNGVVRLIDISDFDLTACGGTHVARTGEVGLVKIVRLERRGGKLRVEFIAGTRAWQDYRLKHEIITVLMSQLTTGSGELSAAVAKLQDEYKALSRQLKKQRLSLAELWARRLLEQGQQVGDVKLFAAVVDDADLRTLGSQLTNTGQVVALLGQVDERTQLVFCRSGDAPGDMKGLLQQALQALGSRSGGGSDSFAQGVAPATDRQQLEALLEEVADAFARANG